MAIEAFAPAKINLTLHVTGQRPDGYHLLDSLVMFADMGDRLHVRPATETRLTVTGPRAAGVPTDASNLVLQAAHLMAVTADITLEKHLPAAAGIGGGSSDAAATLRALAELSACPLPDPLPLGADLPVCLAARTTRMRGIGERVDPVAGLPPLAAVLVNPGLAVPTPAVFAALRRRDNAPMPDPLPDLATAPELIGWLATQRNDLEPAAIRVQPAIGTVIVALAAQEGCGLARMSGSGATCFGLFADAAEARRSASALAGAYPGWWVKPVTLGLNQP